MSMLRCWCLGWLLVFSVAHAVPVNDGEVSPLWLRHAPLPTQQAQAWGTRIQAVWCPQQDSAVLANARRELVRGMKGMTGKDLRFDDVAGGAGVVMLGTLDVMRASLPKGLVKKVEALKPDGFVIEDVEGKGMVITSRSEAGVLYGVFHLLRLMPQGVDGQSLSVVDEPKVGLRMLNHWDDLNGHIERGYAGKSLWKWQELPGKVDARYEEYARLCASLGINGTVLNNVNADPRILRGDYLEKVAVLAEIFRKWGIQTYLSANFSACMKPSATPDKMKKWGGVGDLDLSDPLDQQVQAWWRGKVDEIYQVVPGFGGFLVKADSEGMPGPKNYGRSHLQGANMLADVLKPHGGVVLWRAFVYGGEKDRAKDLYVEFKDFDGKFRDNVFLQVKNGPMDFQPREPFSPVFGAMPQTDLAIELQVTKEYLGFDTTLVYLGPLWSEVFRADTWAEGEGSTVARVVDGSLNHRPKTCIAGVANTGDGPDWCGSVFNQANWYAFGRMAWDHRLAPEVVAREWAKLTFGTDDAETSKIVAMMMGSRDAYVDYTMPMGMSLLCDWVHFLPSPAKREKYHGAAPSGLGLDRSRGGSGYVDQYHPPLSDRLNEVATTPLDYLLWFHHVAWDHRLSSGRSLWSELQFRYDRGVAYVDQMATTWEGVQGVDPARHAAVLSKIRAEQQHARLWRKTCLDYFSQFVSGGSAE